MASGHFSPSVQTTDQFDFENSRNTRSRNAKEPLLAAHPVFSAVPCLRNERNELLVWSLSVCPCNMHIHFKLVQTRCHYALSYVTCCSRSLWTTFITPPSSQHLTHTHTSNKATPQTTWSPDVSSRPCSHGLTKSSHIWDERATAKKQYCGLGGCWDERGPTNNLAISERRDTAITWRGSTNSQVPRRSHNCSCSALRQDQGLSLLVVSAPGTSSILNTIIVAE